MKPSRVIPIQAGDDGPTTTRRGAMRWLAASLALAGTGCGKPPDRPIYSYAHSPEIEVNGTPIHYASAVLRDGFAQGVLVGTQQGRPIKVEGHPSHPASLGGTDVFAQAAVLDLWDPARSQTVRGPAGSDAEVSTWNAFARAWRDRSARWQPGAGLRILSGPVTSPTLQRQIAELLALHPGARWHRDGPIDARRRGSQLAFGRPLQPVWHLDRADLIVALAADPFSQGPAAVRQSADWATARAAALAGDRSPATLVALEVQPGLFGARAAPRWAMTPVDIERTLWRVAAELLPDVSRVEGDAHPAESSLRALLDAHRGRGIALIAGDSLSAPTQALVLALNQHLGAIGRTLDLIEPPDASAAAFDELIVDMQAGHVDTLLMLDVNPSYTAAAATGFDAALQHVPFSVHLGLYRDETAQRCSWHLPQSHAFEQWGDARAFDGTLAPLQPSIAPLYDTRSTHQLLDLLTDDSRDANRLDGHALIRRHWRRDGEGDAAFEARWQAALRAGFVASSVSPPVVVDAAKSISPPAFHSSSDALWTVFPRDASTGDGRFAHNGWLQELPRPFTKITWGNALHIGPATARRLGVVNGDVVRLWREGGAIVEAPVWVQPGHAEGAATLPLGYGRRMAGGVGDGIGVDTAALRGSDGMPVALHVERTGKRHTFAITQVEMDQHGRDLAKEIEPHEHPKEAHAHPHEEPSLYPPQTFVGATAWGMAIDLDACIGCNVCTIACQAENNIPVVGPEQVARGRAMHWIRVDAYLDEDGGALSQPVPCMHCENAPCEVVCPVGATVHDSEGLNVQVYNRCIGTRFCSNNCPYKVRRFNFLQFADVAAEPLMAMRNPDVTVRSRGVMEKCSYCVQRLSRARRDSQKTGVAVGGNDVVTACQGACPTHAIHFGDLNDPNSDVSIAKASPRNYALLGELNTRPRTTYLARVKT